MASRARIYNVIAWTLMGVGLAALVVSVLAYGGVLHSQGISSSSNDWGTFGDFVSGIAGTVIALATLVAIAFTLQLQANELEETREQLRNQARTLERENIEATFFRLLGNRRESIASIRIKDEIGRQCVERLAREVAERINNLRAGQDRPQVSEEVDRFVGQFRLQLDSLIGATAQLLRFASAHADEAEHLDFLAVTRADLSIADQVLLLYVGLSGYGTRFELFELLRDTRMLADMQHNSFSVTVPQQLIQAYEAGPAAAA
jgi:hypothetical protein